MQCSGKFPLAKMLRLSIEPVGLTKIQVGVTALDVDLHTAKNNFAPNEYRGVVNSFGLAVYKGSTQEIKVQLKVKTESKLRGVNSDVKMDWGPVIFTSNVSLPKDDKSASEVIAGQLTVL